VGYFGMAAARSAFEEALRFTREKKINGELMINQEWCQSLLAEMYRNVAVARAACFEGIQASAQHGLWKVLNIKPLYYLTRYTPAVLLLKIFGWLSETPATTWLFRKICFDLQSDDAIDRIDGWGSVAKITGTDAGMKNCQMAVELMGQAGLRHDQRAEKMLRDVKLLQIYEGTNQINRLNVFKRLIAARSCEEACVFSVKTV
jgi:alkylation response protein AidB-like acyl-CoA dehydrogenase